MAETWDHRATRLRRSFTVGGYDQHGQFRREVIPGAMPPLYFWLGADAYQGWRVVAAIKGVGPLQPVAA
jgi:hypothetical protein